MGGRVRWRSVAVRDLDEAYGFIAEESPEAAERLLDAVDKSISLLRENPSAGQLRMFRSPRGRGTRSWPVRGYANYLIFYRVENGDLEVMRFLHGARDLPSYLEADG